MNAHSTLYWKLGLGALMIGLVTGCSAGLESASNPSKSPVASVATSPVKSLAPVVSLPAPAPLPTQPSAQLPVVKAPICSNPITIKCGGQTTVLCSGQSFSCAGAGSSSPSPVVAAPAPATNMPTPAAAPALANPPSAAPVVAMPICSNPLTRYEVYFCSTYISIFSVPPSDAAVSYFETGYNSHLLGCYTTIRDLVTLDPARALMIRRPNFLATVDYVNKMYRVAFGRDAANGDDPTSIIAEFEAGRLSADQIDAIFLNNPATQIRCESFGLHMFL